MRTAFELAALLHRKGTELESKPRWWPEKDHWFVHVVDRAYGEEWLTHRVPPAKAGKEQAAEPAAAYPQDAAVQAEFHSLINEIARTKGFTK